MSDPIASNSGLADLWSAKLASNFSPEWLDGVDDDSTLAESGVYNSYHDLRAQAETALRTLNSDAFNLAAAAAAYDQADADSAAGFN